MTEYRLIRKDPASGDSNCPAVYEELDNNGQPTGAHAVVGRPLRPADLAAGVGEGEVAVYLPPGVLAE